MSRRIRGSEPEGRRRISATPEGIGPRPAFATTAPRRGGPRGVRVAGSEQCECPRLVCRADKVATLLAGFRRQPGESTLTAWVVG